MMNTERHIANLLLGGFSYGEIAQQLSWTRDQVVAKIRSMRIAGLLDANDRPAPKRELPLPVTREPPEPKVEIEFIAPRRHYEARPQGVPILELKSHHCRYPLERSGFFCGAARRDAHTSYCASHHLIVWLPARRYRRE